MRANYARDDQDAEREAREALGRGDHRAALAMLMRVHGEAIYRHCRVVLQDDDLAHDVLQTVFVQAHRDLGSFGGRSNLRGWLFGIARHRCLDALRSRQRQRQRHVSDEGALDVAADPRAGVEALLAAGDDAEQLERCLRELRPDIRIAVLLRFQEGMSYEEMERVCRERSDTLRARVVRSLPFLRRCLEQREAAT